MEEGEPSVFGKELLDNKRLFVYDLVYNRSTELIKSAKGKGLRAYNGLSMLIYQAIESEKIWLEEVTIDYERRVFSIMKKALRKRGYRI